MLTKLVPRWEAALAACRRLGGDARELVVAPPAAQAEIESVERELGRPLPSSLRSLFIEVALHVEVRWFLPSGLEPPFREIFAGDFHASLRLLAQFSKDHASWIRECFGNADNSYDRIWHDKLPFLEVGNGDFLAIDVLVPDGAVVYLSHDDGRGHGRALAQNFADFVEWYSLIGCVGAEDWQWLYFWSPDRLLDAGGANANEWRKWFGLNVEAG